MNCKKCGEQLPENETLCAKCGTDNRDERNDAENISAVPNVRGFSSKKNIVIIALAGVLALGIGGTAAAVGVSNTPSNRISRYMGAAERYLSEQNYEQAIIEFQRILKIDPMNADAYLGMAEAYIALGDIDNAIETLRTGLEQTDDDRIREKLNELLLSLALERGNAYLSEEKYPQAESEFSDALEIDEKCVEAYIGKADSHIGDDDIDKAIEVLQEGFDLTKDSVIKEKLDALIEEQSKLKLSWANIDGDVLYIKYNHYVKKVDDLWLPCDATGKPVSDKKFKYIANFRGTDEANYTLVTTADGRILSLDKDLTELFELEVTDSYTITSQPEPLIITWRHKDEDNDENTNDDEFLRIYTTDGTLLYSWIENECLDGSGKPVYIDDPMVPDKLRQALDDERARGTAELNPEEWKPGQWKEFDCWCDEITTNFGYDAVKTDGSDWYIYFNVDCTIATESSSWIKLDDGHAIGSTWHGGFAQSASIAYRISMNNGELNWEKCNFEADSYLRVRKEGDYTIFEEPLFWKNVFFKYRLCKESEPDMETLFLAWRYNNTDFPDLYSLLDDQHMIFCKRKDGSDTDVYAVYRINWMEHDELFADYSFMEYDKLVAELNKKHERITDFYDKIWDNDELLEMGYLLVCKDDKWGFVSVETGEEVAMYDDASSFSNGYAIVTNNGKGCIIDSNFNVVSDEFPCESAHGLGDGSFVVTNGDEVKRLVINN